MPAGLDEDDPAHRSLGRFFDEEIAKPLDLDFYIGVPDSIPDTRLAPLEPPSLWQRLTQMPLPLVLAAMWPHSVLHRSLVANPGTGFYVDKHRMLVRNLEVPSGGGVGSAHAIAKAYGVFASGGRELGLEPETIEALTAPAVPSRLGFFDECLRMPAQFSLGFMKPNETVPFGHTERVWSAGSRRLDGLRRPPGRHRLRLRDKPDGDETPRRSARPRAAGGDPDTRRHATTPNPDPSGSPNDQQPSDATPAHLAKAHRRPATQRRHHSQPRQPDYQADTPLQLTPYRA